MMRKVLVVLLCLALVMCGFFGCSNQKKVGTEGGTASELAYPERPVTMTIGYTAGGGTDTLARTVASYIDLKGQPMVATNIEGANALVGTLEVYNAKPDGYSLLCGLPETWVAQYLSKATEVELYKSMTPICSFVFDSNVISVSKDSPFQTFDDVVQYAKKNPNKLTIASTGSGGSNEMFSYAMADIAGFSMIYVPYDGAAKSRVAVLGGHNDVLVCQASEAKAFSDSGEIRVLASSTEERISFLPDTPTFKELGYELVFGLHRSFWGPPDMPKEMVAYLEGQFKEVYDNKEVASLLRDKLGFEPVWIGSEDLANISDELGPNLSKWVDLIK